MANSKQLKQRLCSGQKYHCNVHSKWDSSYHAEARIIIIIVYRYLSRHQIVTSEAATVADYREHRHTISSVRQTNLKAFPVVIRPPNVSREGRKFYPWTFFFPFFLSFLCFNQSTVLSSRAVDGHQMYFGCSVVGKASTIGMEISPTPPLIFIGDRKVRNLASFKTSLKFEPRASALRASPSRP